MGKVLSFQSAEAKFKMKVEVGVGPRGGGGTSLSACHYCMFNTFNTSVSLNMAQCYSAEPILVILNELRCVVFFVTIPLESVNLHI